MAISPKQAQDESQAFSDAFAQDEVKKPEMSEDEAFGLTDESSESQESPEAEAAEPVQESPAQEAAEPTDAGPAEAAADSAPDVAIVVSPDEGESDPVDPKDAQRQKSWEGRLRAKEAELKAREEALKAAPGVIPPEAPPAAEAPAEEAAEPAAESPVQDAVEEVAEKVESGEMTVEQAMATLGNDFGPEFTKMLGVLIEAKATEISSRTADEKMGSVKGELDGVVGELNTFFQKEHQESISDAHPDFVEVAASPEFKEYIDALPGSEQEAAKQVIQSGTARQINKLLNTYKASKKDAPEDTQAMDDAEGVRSSGLKIPEKPAKADSYAEAWNEF